MKRYTDSEKWGDPAFRALSPIFKCLWLYIQDQADIAGFWTPSEFDVVALRVGVPSLSEAQAKEALGGLIHFHPSHWQIKGFFNTQYSPRPGKALSKFAFGACDLLKIYAQKIGGEVLKVAFISEIPEPFKDRLSIAIDRREVQEKAEGQKLTPPVFQSTGGDKVSTGGDSTEILLEIAWARVVVEFKARGLTVLDAPGWARRQVAQYQRDLGAQGFDRALGAYLKDQDPKPKTVKQFLNNVDHWVQVGKAAPAAVGCAHDWEDFEEPADKFPNGVKFLKRRCRHCRDQVFKNGSPDNSTVQPWCDHGNREALATVETPWRKGFRQTVVCTLCGLTEGIGIEPQGVKP